MNGTQRYGIAKSVFRQLEDTDLLVNSIRKSAFRQLEDTVLLVNIIRLSF